MITNVTLIMQSHLRQFFNVSRSKQTLKYFSTGCKQCSNKKYKVVIAGCGSGGCAMAAKFGSQLGKGMVAVIEPSKTHYYQPMWTLVGAGIKTLNQSSRPMASLVPKTVDWIQDSVAEFQPEKNKVATKNGDEIEYEYLIVAIGLQLNYKQIKGLPEAFDTPGVCSNYSDKYVNKTLEAFNNFKEGNAIFTFPNTPIKCAGAPQKIMYLCDHYLRQKKTRDQAKILFNTSLAAIFGVKKYAEALLKCIAARDIAVNYQHNLVEVRPDKKEVVFEKLNSTSTPKETEIFKYELIHVVPPMSTPDVLKRSPLVDSTGFLNVNKHTLQHVNYSNVFGIGDCTNVPTSKTTAAAAAQCGILKEIMTNVMNGKPAKAQYDGYTSCPLITGYGTCILAEFDYDAQPLETFPIDQGKERHSMYYLKKDVMPEIYWNLMMRGYWEGPKPYRKLMHLGMGK